MPVILSQRIDTQSDYDDVPFRMYHYPKRYRNQVKSGDIFIYYQGDRWKQDNRYYFGVGVIGTIEVSDDGEHYYAEILEGVPFTNKVPIYNPTGGFFESIDYESVRNRPNPPWQSSIRPISQAAFDAVINFSETPVADFSSLTELYNVDNPLRVLELLNRKYNGIPPRQRERFLRTHIDRGQSVTVALKKVLGAKCQICGTVGFLKPNGERYIEAHHLTQLSNLRQNSLCSENIILVCPNCHREIHYGMPVFVEDCGNEVHLKLGSKETIIMKNTMENLRIQ